MIASMPVCQARALLRIAADAGDPIRKYLQGFWLEPSGIAVATNGACLLAIRDVQVDFRGPPVFIARDALEPFLKGKAATDTLVIERGALRIGAATVGCAHPEAAGVAGATEPTMNYPAWRRIIPQKVSGSGEHQGKSNVERYVLDSRLLERLRIAIGELSGKSPAKSPPVFPMMNGTSAAVLDTGTGVLAVLMPMRTGKTFTRLDIDAHCATWSASQSCHIKDWNPTADAGAPVAEEVTA